MDSEVESEDSAPSARDSGNFIRSYKDLIIIQKRSVDKKIDSSVSSSKAQRKSDEQEEVDTPTLKSPDDSVSHKVKY